MEKVKITINNNGSIRIEGEVELYDGSGNKFELGDKKIFSLCRCGLSNKKPFCDGSHKGNFVHECQAWDLTK
ncbi:MAG: CDGSH iron-sulfur domain-containing protein [Bacteroidia bacterium]|nr:CDGSH iron-sulfur domain-containing protein [Bacteroidia bacterium]MDW8159504.1 CDGSH iron-sulfur domain-containing protein [Bacteroidia bacterium]